MKIKRAENPFAFHLIAWICSLSVCFEGPIISCYGSTLLINRSSFPAGFLFGAGLSAYQSEGATHIEGRKPGIWDTFTKNYPEKIADHSNGDVADNFYFQHKEDIALMKEIGLDSFRFSISWSRVLPYGKIGGGVNRQGVDFYNNLIDELISNGIEPFVSIFHFDLPQALEDEYGGFLSPKIVKDYVDFADFCFKEFGDRVKYWVTINEPENYSLLGYVFGIIAPGRCSNYCPTGNSATEPYVVTHHELLCHATAFKLYRKNYQASQNGFIGISIYSYWIVPKFQTVASKRAASRAFDFQFGWIFDPITYGNYPETMRNLVGDRLPNFTRSQSEMIKGSVDFVGLNYYSAIYADEMTSYTTTNLSFFTDCRVNLTLEKNGIPIGEPTDMIRFNSYPKGIRELLRLIKKKYNSPTIYITENGMGDSSRPPNYAVNDSSRINYYYLHLSYLLKAIKDGVDVRGYYAWSFLDSFEWLSGYTARYGMIYVDYKNGLKRCFKKSALWYQNFLQKRNSSLACSLKLSSDQ